MHNAPRLVLVLDDDPAVRDLLKFVLEQNGILTRLFVSAVSLMQAMPMPEAGCLVLGHRPPAVNCFQVLAGLAAIGHVLPVIVMTDHASPAFCRRAARAHVRQVIEKPALDGSLVSSIQCVLTPACQTSIR